MATLADATERYNLTGPGARETSLALLPFASLLRIGPSRPATNMMYTVSGSIGSTFIKSRESIREMVQALRRINDEKDKQRAIVDRIERIEEEDRLESRQFERQEEIEEDTRQNEDINSSGILQAITSLIARATISVARAAVEIARTARRLARGMAVRIIPGAGLAALAAGVYRGVQRSVEGGTFREGYREGRETVFNGLSNFLFGEETEPRIGQQQTQEYNEGDIRFRPEMGPTGNVEGDPRFQAELIAVSNRLGIHPANLLAVMRVESGVRTTARNTLPGQTATGLIQFTEGTARRLGTTTAAIREMDAVQQLQLVESYFRMTGLPSGASAGMIYAHVFLPGRVASAISRGDGVLTQRGENYYSLNPILDVNNDGFITIDDLENKLASRGAVASRPAAPSRTSAGQTTPQTTPQARPQTETESPQIPTGGAPEDQQPQNESNSSRPTSSGQPMPIPASMPQNTNTNRIAAAARPQSTTQIQTIFIRDEIAPVRV